MTSEISGSYGNAPVAPVQALPKDASGDRRRRRWLPWLNRAVLATLDQGLVSGSNFVLTVMLARWLSASDYGAYGLVLSILALITAVHQALLLEPMSILGAARFGTCQRAYLAGLQRVNAGFSIGVSLLLAVSAFCAHLLHAPGRLSLTLAALALSLPATLLFWLVRGGCYLALAPGPSAFASLGYSAIVLAGAFILNRLDWMSAATALLWIGAAGGMGAMIVMNRFRPPSGPEQSAPDLWEICAEHWRYGKWALAATPVTWIPENICYAFAGMSLGLEKAGVLRAMMNFVTPGLQLATSSSRLLYPYLSGKAIRQRNAGIRISILKVAMLFTGIGILYAFVLAVFHGQLFHLLYGKRLGESSDMVAWMGLVTISYLVLYAPMIGLRIIQAPALVFVAYCAAAAVALAAGLPLTMKYGLRGTVVSLCLTNSVAFAAASYLLYRRTARPKNSAWLP